MPVNSIDNNIEPKSAFQNPFISIPGTIAPANINNTAFITKVSKPNVNILTGSVINISIGLMVKLISPNTIASIDADSILSTSIPGINHPVNIIAKP